MTSTGREHTGARERDDVQTTLRTVLLGPSDGRSGRGRLAALAVGLFGLTFLAYELDVFYHAGGVVFVPFHAVIVGGIAAVWAGYSREGLVAGWGLTYLSLLGMRAEWATDISPRPLVERVAYVVELDGLLALAVIGAVVAVVGWSVGALARKGITALRGRSRTDTDT
jgi:hypothetical protein